MEFFEKDNHNDDSDGANITLCLWGNLAKNVRHKGLDIPSLGFSFELPPELLKINCAVRILHTSFDNITHLFCESSVPLHWRIGKKPVQGMCIHILYAIVTVHLKKGKIHLVLLEIFLFYHIV